MTEDKQFDNLPDVLGAITGGKRVDLGLVQCALAVRPKQAPAGQPMEAILLVQSSTNADIDVRVRFELPEKDRKGKPGRFLAKAERLVVGLRPAEVGFVAMPFSTVPLTAPARGYRLSLWITIKKLSRKAPQIREPGGGGYFNPLDLPRDKRELFDSLLKLEFTAKQGDHKNQLVARFDILPPSGLAPRVDLSPRWESLWTLHNMMDDEALVAEASDVVAPVLARLKRGTVFFPLLRAVQSRFNEKGGYMLQAGEAVHIAKLLTLTMEIGPDLAKEGAIKGYPRWYVRLCQLALESPDLLKNTEYLVSELLFLDLIYDATMLGFEIIATITGEDLGTQEERSKYAEEIVEALRGRGGLDFTHVYLPLTLAGLASTGRLVMIRESVPDTVLLFEKAYRARRSEINEANAEVYELAGNMLKRVLAML